MLLLLPVPYQHVPVLKPEEVIAQIGGGDHQEGDEVNLEVGLESVD